MPKGSSWRPKGWKNPADDMASKGDPSACEFANGHEAGADTMLIGRDKEVRSRIMSLDNELDSTFDGNVLFRSMILSLIPGDEDK